MYAHSKGDAMGATFPKRPTLSSLRQRTLSKDVVEFDESGGIDYLALGSRAAGIGPTLPPATNAVAIRADPANAASAGDLVQVWETDPPRRVLTGELRGVAGEVVTVAIDAGDTPKLDPTTTYKLITLPVQDRPDREFASLLRAADETLSTITVEPGSRADGMAVDALGVTVAAVTREDEQPTPLPARDRVLRAGDVLYAIATPDALRKLEATTRTPDDVTVDESDEPPSEADLDDDPFAGEEDELADEPDQGAGNEPADEGTASEPAATDAAHEGTEEAERTNGDGGDRQDEPRADEEPSPKRDRDDEIPSGGAFPDSDDLPGIDPTGAMETATGDEESAEDDEIPDTDAFPDTGDLPGTDVADASVDDSEAADDEDDLADGGGSDEGDGGDEHDDRTDDDRPT